MAERLPTLRWAGGVGTVFADFAMLPDLLRRGHREPVTVSDWTSHFEQSGFDEDHLHLADMPRNRSLHARFVAADAIRFCMRLHLLDPDGQLTGAGRRVAELAGLDSPPPEGPDMRARELATVLAEQLERYYLGAGDRPLVPFLRDASEHLARPGQPWTGWVDGLLLAEVDTLLWWGFADAERAAEVARGLAGVRHRVLGLLTEANPAFVMEAGEEAAGREYVPGAVSFSDAVAIWHYDQPDLAGVSDFSITELRVTAMALVFAELFTEKFWQFRISVLAPPGAGSQ
ncbi:MAG: hypothetical protein OXI73_11685 [Rhodospirillales bacterium]|nr:hypothetical protein [Rhodospirillales bacterium]